jgi:diadenosine tetraphosphate (Ap4A) HIT family hydrolase
MAFTPEQAGQIKEQLIAQIDNSEMQNKEQVKEHLKNLNEEQLEQFLNQNNIELKQGQLQQADSPEPSQQTKCIFCSIINEEMPSYKIAESVKAIAILEINPLSKGHVLVLPKEHTTVEDMPRSVLGLAQKISKKIKTKLKPEEVRIENSSFMDHAMVNVIPIYKEGKLEKYKAEENELRELQDILETKKRGPRTPRKQKVRTTSSGKLPKISFRIP